MFQIAENSLQNTVVGYLKVVDEDLNQDQTCEIVNLLDHPFKVILPESIKFRCSSYHHSEYTMLIVDKRSSYRKYHL